MPEEDLSPKKQYTLPGMGDTAGDNRVTNPEIAFIFDPNRDLFPNKPYFDDGNPDFYSEENIKKREALKTDPVVKEAIDNFITREFKTVYNDEKPISKQEYI